MISKIIKIEMKIVIIKLKIFFFISVYNPPIKLNLLNCWDRDTDFK